MIIYIGSVFTVVRLIVIFTLTMGIQVMKVTRIMKALTQRKYQSFF
jgi:hypothetical protein